ncbi:hypothetical protein SNE40_006860 [Patella caerulea]|uniref:Fork-head domain-containing protein n=1 Tax=Patella caerulea TaxID=87958 RepID=A0AAN8PT04_PATCE
MEYFAQMDADAMSLIDTMSNEERHELDLFLNSDRQDCAMDINLKTEPGCGLPDLDHLDSNQDYNTLQWMQPNNLGGQFRDENESENTDPNLLVNPQTVIPVDIYVNTVASDSPSLPNITGVESVCSSSGVAQTLPNNIQLVTVSNHGGIEVSQSQNSVVYHHVTFSTQQQNIPLLSKTVMSPSQSSPVLVGHLQNGLPPQSRPIISLPAVQSAIEQGQEDEKKKMEKVFPKPVYSYSCLIALALKNSVSGNLPVSEIYTFMTENYPYFKTAPDGWKNSVRHNLSLNKCFQKAETPKQTKPTSTTKKGCLWALNPAKIEKMEEEIVKWRQKDPKTLQHSMAHPEKLELIESGRAGVGTSKNNNSSTNMTATSTPITIHIPESSVHSSLSTPLQHPSTPNHQSQTPDVFMSDLRDINVSSQFGVDPALSELASGLWDDDINCDLGLDLVNSPLCVATVASPMGSCNSPLPHHPTTPSGQYGGHASYHGTCFYASSPVQLGSPSTIPNNMFYATPSPRTLFA